MRRNWKRWMASGILAAMLVAELSSGTPIRVQAASVAAVVTEEAAESTERQTEAGEGKESASKESTSMTEEEARGRELLRKYQDTLVPLELPPVVPRLDREKYPIVSSQEVPASYDSRTTGVIPPVRNQEQYGICWAFASIAMAEASLIRQGLAEADEVDLSEYHLGYYSHRFVTDPLGGTAGDNNYRQDLLYDILGKGAFYNDAKSALSAWIGAVPETVTGYPDPPVELEESQEAAYGHNQAILKDVRVINYEDEQEVKCAIMEYGAVGFAYHSPEESGNNDQYFNFQEWAQYIPMDAQVKTTNHAVAVVGWDDNFSREKFGIASPTRDGAWLVRNSWGETDFGIGGYFWLSYEDASIYGNVYAFDMQAADVYDNNYQYDGSAADQILGMKDKIEAANVFTAKGNPGEYEYLQAVSFEVYSTNLDYTIQIYTELQDPADPVSGTAALERPVQGKTTHSGYYTVPLGKDILLDQGDTFSVVIKFEKLWEDVDIVMENTSIDREHVSAIEQGQSFLNMHRTGYDWMDLNTYYNGNWRIKAFTRNVEDKPVTGIVLSETSGMLKAGETKQLTATVLPENAFSQDVLWESSAPAIASVSSSGLITALSQGSVQITAGTQDGGHEAVCRLEVEADPVITDVAVSQLQADSATITITANDGDRTLASWSLKKVSGSGNPVISQQSQKHVFRITGLTPASSYTFLAEVTDSAGNKAEQRVSLTTLEDVEVTKAPVFTPPAGTYAEDQQVRLSTETEGAVIYYTIDGTVPSAENGILYTSPIKVNRRQAIRAVAVKEGRKASAVAEASYQLERPWIFSDVVPDGKWKHESVQYVYNNGIMSGVASETPGFQLFQADRPLSRSMFATVLYRMEGEPAVVYREQFPDVEPGKWYSNAILWAYEEGIVSGLGSGRFGIDDNITREQIAKMLYLYAERKGYDISGRRLLDTFTDQDQVSSWAIDHMQWATAVEMISGKPNEDGKTYRLDGKGSATRAECAAMLMRFENRYIPME